jgi:hypothetical protein
MSFAIFYQTDVAPDFDADATQDFLDPAGPFTAIPAPDPWAGAALGALQLAQATAQFEPSSGGTTTTGTRTSTTGSSGGTTTLTTGGTSSAVPSWVSALSTPSIAADMAAADVNGTVTYAGLEKLLTDLDSSLGTGTLTSAELRDLKTIAANLNNGMTTSSYLTYAMNALVNGNAANATWTGGGAASTSLGNLAVGSSATQLAELIDKWFLGTDLPSSTVVMSGYPTFSVSYAFSSSPLFGTSGPSMNDINQGYLGDCYVLACLAEVAHQDSGIISTMFTVNGNNTYGVRYYVNGVAEYVTVDNELTDEFNTGTDIWASLAEKGYAQLQASGVVTGNTINYGDSWSTIGNGGYPEYALEEITGASQITDFVANGRSWETFVYNSSLNETSSSTGSSTATVLKTLIADLAAGDDLVLSSNTNATASNGMTTLVADHALSIYGYDSSTGMLEIRNPWGTMAGQYWETTFEVSLATLLSDGDVITADNVGTGGAAGAPEVTAQTASQTWKQGQALNLTLAANTFTDPQGETLTYTATLASGAALPSWLNFNASTLTFTGTVPALTSGLSIKVTATDSSGLSNSETFTVSTPASAPTVTNQTTAQTWKEGQAVNFKLATNTFTDPQSETLTYSAKLANGGSLPSWLKFNASTDTFTGTAPKTASTLSIKVTATDTSGLSASETFSVSIAASTSQLISASAGMVTGASATVTSTVDTSSTQTTHLASPVA